MEPEEIEEYCNLNPAEKRAINISRQQKYLDSLFGAPSSSEEAELIVQKTFVQIETDSRLGIDKFGEVSIQTDKQSFRITEGRAPLHRGVDWGLVLRDVKRLFVGRDGDLTKLVNFLSRISFNLNECFLLSGFSGSGKTSMVDAVLCGAKLGYAKVLCSGYSTSRQLLRAVWLSIQQCSNYKTVALIDYNKLPSSLEELFAALSSITNPIYVLLDRIDFVENLEDGLCTKLLNASELSGNHNIKMIGTSSSYILCRCIRIQLRSLDDTELELVMKRKAEKQSGPRYEGLQRVIQLCLRDLLAGTRHCGELWNLICFIYDQVSSSEVVISRNTLDPYVAQALRDPSVQSRGNARGISLLSVDWIDSLSLASKCVLLSAFCASNNDKKSDAFTFGQDRRGKRRRVEESGEPRSDPQDRGGGHVFGFERLASIFVQLSSTVGGGMVSEETTRVLKKRHLAGQREAMGEVVTRYGEGSYFTANVSVYCEYTCAVNQVYRFFLRECVGALIDRLPTSRARSRRMESRKSFAHMVFLRISHKTFFAYIYFHSNLSELRAFEIARVLNFDLKAFLLK